MPKISEHLESKLREVLAEVDLAKAISRLEAETFPMAGPGSELEARIQFGIVRG